MSKFNRIANARNRFQGPAKRVLCVCSAGLLRSPTVAWILSNDPYNYNTRAAGITSDFALIPVDDALIEWADQIVFVEPSVFGTFQREFDNFYGKEVVVLRIPDEYEFRNPKLVETIKEQYSSVEPITLYRG